MNIKIDFRHQTQNTLPNGEKSLLLSVIFIPRRIDKTENTGKVFGMQVDFHTFYSAVRQCLLPQLKTKQPPASCIYVLFISSHAKSFFIIVYKYTFLLSYIFCHCIVILGLGFDIFLLFVHLNCLHFTHNFVYFIVFPSENKTYLNKAFHRDCLQVCHDLSVRVLVSLLISVPQHLMFVCLFVFLFVCFFVCHRGNIHSYF